MFTLWQTITGTANSADLWHTDCRSCFLNLEVLIHINKFKMSLGTIVMLSNLEIAIEEPTMHD